MRVQGGLEPLTKAGLSVHLETQREVASAFNSLTLNDDNKGAIARHPAMSSLVHLCQSPDVECARCDDVCICLFVCFACLRYLFELRCALTDSHTLPPPRCACLLIVLWCLQSRHWCHG